MRDPPQLPPLEETSSVLDGGHLWIQEYVEGSPLQFEIGEDGTLSFGDRHRHYGDDPPLSIRPAIGHVQSNLDWEALYDADVDPTTIQFFGVATRNEGIDYGWERIPPFLGTDVWVTAREAFLPPDAVERVYSRLGLDPITVHEKELPVRDFDRADYDPVESAWYDGPARGVVLRTKGGERAKLISDAVAASDVPDCPDDPEELINQYVTDDRLQQAVDTIDADGQSYTVESVNERVLELIAREAYRELDANGIDLDTREIRSVSTRRVREWLDER